MSPSGFNNKTTLGLERENEILLPYRSERYLYYKTRRHGLLLFVKKPSPEFEADMLTIEALKKEFMMCFPLTHPSITRYVSFEDNALYEEFIDGQTLREMIDSGDELLKDPQFVEKTGRQLFEALDYLHGHGVLHLDIKPENLMITRIGNNLKIIDFGCAESSVFDTTGGYTEDYKAPEQGVGPTGIATDIYLGGMVIKELAALSGSQRKWRRFVKATTARKAEDRIGTAGEALQLIPKRREKLLVPYMVGLAGLLTLIAGIILIGRENASESIAMTEPQAVREIAEADSATDTAVDVQTAEIADVEEEKETPPETSQLQEVVTAPLPEVVTAPVSAPAEPKTEDLEEKLNKEIEKHINDYYLKNVFPVLKDSVNYRGIEGSHEFTLLTHQALQRGEDDALEFGKKLVEKYPDKENMISIKVTTMINANNSLFGAKLYKRY